MESDFPVRTTTFTSSGHNRGPHTAAFRAPLALSFTDAGELVGQRPQRPGLVIS